MTKQAPKRLAVRRMPADQRWILGIVGLAVEVAGVASVFLTDNELGSVALVLVGAILLALATFGLVPMRVAYKDAELVISELMDDVVDEAGSAAAERILDKAEEVLPRPVVDEARSRVRNAIEYEKSVFAALRRVGRGIAELTAGTPQAPDIGVDVVARRGDQVAYIEVKSGGGSRGNIAKRTLDVMYRAQRLPGRWLLITDTPITTHQIDRLSQAGVGTVLWRDEHDDEALRQAVRELFNRPRGRT